MESVRSESRKMNLLFSGLQAFYWAAYCSYYSFLVAFLLERGYSEFFCGIVTTLVCVVSVITQPIIGYIVDMHLSVKTLMIAFFALSIPSVFLMQIGIGSAFWVLVSTVLFGLLEQSMFPMIDSWLVKEQQQGYSLNYGLTRGMGSLGYAFTGLFFGRVIETAGYQWMFIAHAILLSLAIVCCFLLQGPPMKRNTKEKKTESEEKVGLIQAVSVLIKNRTYIMFILSILFYQLSLKICTTYLPVLVRSVNGTTSDLGWGIFFTAVFEAPTMLLVGRLMRKSDKTELLFFLTVLINSVRLLILALWPNWVTIVPLQGMQAVSYGIYLIVFLEYIKKHTPEKLHATAILLGTAIALNGGSIVGDFLGGVIVDRWGLNSYILFSLCSAGAALLLYFTNLFSSKKEPIAEKI